MTDRERSPRREGDNTRKDEKKHESSVPGVTKADFANLSEIMKKRDEQRTDEDVTFVANMAMKVIDSGGSVDDLEKVLQKQPLTVIDGITARKMYKLHPEAYVPTKPGGCVVHRAAGGAVVSKIQQRERVGTDKAVVLPISVINWVEKNMKDIVAVLSTAAGNDYSYKLLQRLVAITKAFQYYRPSGLADEIISGRALRTDFGVWQVIGDYRSEYVFLPPGLTEENYINLIRRERAVGTGVNQRHLSMFLIHYSGVAGGMAVGSTERESLDVITRIRNAAAPNRSPLDRFLYKLVKDLINMVYGGIDNPIPRLYEFEDEAPRDQAANAAGSNQHLNPQHW